MDGLSWILFLILEQAADMREKGGLGLTSFLLCLAATAAQASAPFSEAELERGERLREEERVRGAGGREGRERR